MSHDNAHSQMTTDGFLTMYRQRTRCLVFVREKLPEFETKFPYVYFNKREFTLEIVIQTIIQKTKNSDMLRSK